MIVRKVPEGPRVAAVALHVEVIKKFVCKAGFMDEVVECVS